MRYCNAIIIMMILVSAVYADITFLRIYETEGDFVCPWDVIEVTGGGYACMNHAFDWSFLRTDEYGEVLVQEYSFWGRCLCENQDVELVIADYLYEGGDYGVRFVWTNSMGNILRTRDYFGISEDATPNCIIQTSDKGYIICGEMPYYPLTNGFVMKLDSLENYQWHIELSDAYLYSIVEDNENCFLAGGETLTEDYVIKISQDGNIIWENEYPYSSTFHGAYGIVQTSSGYVFASPSCRVVGISSSGSFQWQYESEVLQAMYIDVCVATNGNVVACGFDNESGVLTRLDSYGNLIWENEYENCELRHIYRTADSGFVSAGRYTADLPDDDCLLLKVDSEGNYEPLGIETEPEMNNLQLFPVYPNPVTESATINYCLTEPVAVMISVFEVSGRLISFPVDCISAAGTYSFEINDLLSGMYMVRMKAGEHELVQRFVVIN